ncbi:hypothetical protein TrRE_jg7880, partial [Triparma retinervis]
MDFECHFVPSPPPSPPPSDPLSDPLEQAIAFLSSIKSYDDYKAKPLRNFRLEFKRVMEFAKRDMFAGKTEAEYRKFCFEQKNEKVLKQRERARVLKNARSCYTCKARFNVLHSFYDQLCPACAELNWKKRVQTRPLIGENGTPYVSIVTGGRVKIGHRIVLKLLRAGSLVVATTRFPVAGAKVYEKYGEEYERWIKEGRLHVVGLDLRDLVSVE